MKMRDMGIEDITKFLETFSRQFDTLILSISYGKPIVEPVKAVADYKVSYVSLWSGIPAIESIIEKDGIVPRSVEISSENKNLDIFILEGCVRFNSVRNLIADKQPIITYDTPTDRLEMYKIKS